MDLKNQFAEALVTLAKILGEKSPTEDVDDKINMVLGQIESLGIEENQKSNLKNSFFDIMNKWKGNSFYKMEEYDKAISCWLQISSDYVGISAIYYMLGLAYLEKDNDSEEEAVRWLNKLNELKQDSSTKELIDDLLAVLGIKKNYTTFRKAQAESIRAAKKVPKNHPQYADLTHIIDLTNLEESVTVIKRLMHHYPNNPYIPLTYDFISELVKFGAYRVIPHPIIKSVRKTTLELVIKYNRLQVKEIAEKCQEPEDVIIVILKEMLKNKEIYGEYFKSSESFVFDQTINVKELDSLMQKFNEWEKEYTKLK